MPILAEQRSYVAGRWITGDEVVSVENPADESHVADITATPLKEIERAIAEARRSFDSGVWADTPVQDRARVLHAFIDHVEGARDALVPTPGRRGRPADILRRDDPVAHRNGHGARQTIDLFLSMKHEEASPVPVDELLRGRVALSLRRHEPVGVVTAITPYNAALIMGFQKLIPALMAGNSLILRPSPLTPISSLIFGAAADAAGLPPGVLERGGGGGHRGRRTAHQPPRGRHGVFHRLDAGRAQDHGSGGADRQTSFARTRRQVGTDLPADAVHRARQRRGGVVAPLPVRPVSPRRGCSSRRTRKNEVLEAVSAAYRPIKVGPPTDPSATWDR